jgi:Ig-like domain CHU_C associated/Secretion system C-terminal sorting domain
MKKKYTYLVILLLSIAFSPTLFLSCNHKNESAYELNEEDHDEYDMPGAAAEFEYRRNIDPATGTVPHERMWQAVLETEALKNIDNNSTSSSSALAPLTWTERGSNSDATGPSNGNPRPGNGVTSGRMKAIWVDILDPTGNTVWVGGVWGGIWKTTNITSAAPTWTPVNDFLSNLVVTGICQDPTNPNTMYMATGESGLLASYSIVGIIRGDGIFKSTDHGITWNQLPNSISLTNCTKILCDATGNLYVSTVGIGITGNPNTGVLGLLRSTDGGANFVNINPFTTPSPNATSRIVDFEISSTGVMHVIGGLNSAVGVGGYRYTANPSTATTTTGWNTPATLYPIPTGQGARVEITTNGSNIYAAISNADKIDNIAKSIDGGANWTTTALTATNITALNGGGQGAFSNTIGVDPLDPNTVIVGSLNLLKSTDGGLNFFKISEWVGTTGQYCHADQHAIVWYDNGNKLLVGTDGGLFYSTNKGANISDKNTGLRLKQFYGVAAHPTLPNYFLCGSQDNGTHQFNNPGLSSSIEVTGGDGGTTGIDQDEPQFQAGAYVYANFRRSSNGGASWSSNGNASTAGLFINPYDYDNAANKIYAGNVAGQFYRWENPHTGFTLTSVPISDFGTGLVTSVTSSALTANRAYFGLSNGRIIKVDNADAAAPTPTAITPAAMPAAAYVTCVAEASVNTQNLIATVANYGATSIYSTTDGGTTWAACDGNLPDMPVYWAVYHPDGDTKAYIATETGVWSTDLLNGAATVWSPETTFPTVKTSMLKYRASDRTIAAATYGRGLWTATIPNTNCTAASITTQPINTSICEGGNTTISIVGAGTAPLTYQWQLSTTGAGGPWNNITNNTTYSNATTAALTITNSTLILNTYQYRCIVTGNCAPLTATSNPAILTVNTSPLAPVVTSSVVYCQDATATALSATGTNLKWYTVATGGTGSTIAPTPSTTSAGTVNYYVSQTTGTCESPRASIAVTVNSTPTAPVATSSVNYCQNATATALSATGTNLKWYTVPTGGAASTTAPIPNTAIVGSTTYYVSQTTGICEGPRTAIVVNITATPSAPTVVSPLTYCQGITAPALTASGAGLLWYTTATGGTGSATAPIPSTASVGSTTYYVSQTTGCESGRSAIVVNVTPGSPLPVVSGPVVYCQGANAVALTATGTNLLWYTTATGGTGNTTAPTPSTTAVGSTTYYVTQNTGTCESPRVGISVTVNATPSAPIVTSPTVFCQNATPTALTATGTNLLWYTSATGGTGSTTAPIPSTTTLGTTNYYVSQTTGICEGPRALITVSILSISPAPTVVSPIIYCQNSTAVPLTATGTNLLWYTSATGGTGSTTAPTPSTTATGSTTYYVTQNSTCGESVRTAITVTVNATPTAPAVAALQYCQGTTAVALTATGTNLLWYTTATGGTGSSTAPTPSTTAVGTTNYYVSQTVLNCESPRALLAVTVNATPNAPIITTPITYCLNATATALTATGTNLKWYTTATGGTANTTAPTPSTNTIGSTTYYVSQSTGTCEGPRAAIVVNVTAITAAPTVISPIAYCQGSTAAALTATGTNLLWYTAATGGTGSATAPTPLTTTVGSTTYYVSQTGTCESARTAVVVNVTITPAAPTATSPIEYCQGSPSTALTATGTGLLWYTVATGGTGTTTAPIPSTTTAGSTIYYVSQKTGLCEGPRAAITVNVSAAPSITAQPQDITSCTTTATFNVTATGTSLTYQWFLSTDGGTIYNPIATATSSTLVVNGLTAAQANHKYRVVVSSGSCTAATSNSVTARVGTNPVVTLNLSPNTAYNPLTFNGLIASVTPAGTYVYEWKRNTQVVSGNSTASLTKSNGLVDEFGTYQVSAKDPITGCTGISSDVIVADNPTTRESLLIAPNPTQGLLRVTYYSENVNTQKRNISVYDEKGSRIIVSAFTISGRYGLMNLDLTTYPKGTYVVVLSDANGRKITNAKIIKN